MKTHVLCGRAEGTIGKTRCKMVNNSDAMTVSQLVDLVKFLQSHYELEEYDPAPYPMY